MLVIGMWRNSSLKSDTVSDTSSVVHRFKSEIFPWLLELNCLNIGLVMQV